MTDDNDNLRASYDRLAETYTQRVANELVGKPFDLELLDRFAKLASAQGLVLDLGCGPGHVGAYLRARGVEIVGIDISDGMVEQARRLHPGMTFQQGSMERLHGWSGLAGILAFYSIIHIDRTRQPDMFADWRAALAPDGYLLLSFHVGVEDRHRTELWGVPIAIDFHFFLPEEIEQRLVDAGFDIIERHEREPYAGVEVETRRCYILARVSSAG